MIRRSRFSPTIHQSVPLAEMVALVQRGAAGSASEARHVVDQIARAHHQLRGRDTGATSRTHREQSANQRIGQINKSPSPFVSGELYDNRESPNRIPGFLVIGGIVARRIQIATRRLLCDVEFMSDASSVRSHLK
jgi:hypothetical protein